MVHGDGADVDEFGQVVFVGDLLVCQLDLILVMKGSIGGRDVHSSHARPRHQTDYDFASW